MARQAGDIAKVAQQIAEKNYKKSVKEATIALREKCVTAVTAMTKAGELSTEVEVDESDLDGLDNVVEEMRKLNYRHAFIEVQNEEGDLIEHRLRVSVAHLA